MRKILVSILLPLFVSIAASNPMNFNLYKLESNPSKPVLLIMSGIQGDEPGGFNATSIFIKNYKIKSGNVWVIPNLNQYSIIKNNRGIYGDMNRKFAALSKNDPEYRIIQEIKKIILDSRVEAILHLHDGSGFYREKYINNLLNQNRWGNCSIIDQDTLFEDKDLNNKISYVVDYINSNLLKELHRYRVKNTNTALGDKEQEKSLTYFATLNKKMAFANEASKSLSLNERVYYHLLAIEGMLDNLGIKFERNFEFNLKTIDKLINDENMDISINGIIKLPLFNLKNKLDFFPLDKNNLSFESNTPIISLSKEKQKYKIKNGNKNIAYLNPFFIEFDNGLENAKLNVDGEELEAKIGDIIKVKNVFKIINLDENYRVNVIGYTKKNTINEAEINIEKKDLINKFSIDKNGNKFRIEFYKKANSEEKEKFSGMIIVDFSN